MQRKEMIDELLKGERLLWATKSYNEVLDMLCNLRLWHLHQLSDANLNKLYKHDKENVT